MDDKGTGSDWLRDSTKERQEEQAQAALTLSLFKIKSNRAERGGSQVANASYGEDNCWASALGSWDIGSASK